MPREPEITYRIMSAIKSKNTTPERALAKIMWFEGLRYRKHYKVLGKPDFVFPREKIAIFVDGDFWHGHNWVIRGLPSLEYELSTYSDFWKQKILRNIERDKEVNKTLEKDGWQVMRFWESEIKTDPFVIVEKIKNTLFERRKKIQK